MEENAHCECGASVRTKIFKDSMLAFVCTTKAEVWRAKTWRTKEPGTLAWLEAEVKPGDVFWDVGANVGVYSLYAAKLGAQVVAFEPHVGTAASLIRNIRRNGLADKITVITSPLSDEAGWVDFHYYDCEAGSSGSQIDKAISETGKPFVPAITERKYGVTGRDLIIMRSDALPNLLKIDVDGQELRVLKGIPKDGLRSLQVEIHPQTEVDITNYLRGGFAFASKHYTQYGRARIEQGDARVAHNAIFRRPA